MSTTLIRRAKARLGGFHDEGHGFDVFGLHLPTLRRTLAVGGRLCDRYFRTRSYGVDNVPREGPAILVANHGGALPIDAALVVLDVDRATGRIVRPIADRFIPSLPLISTWFARTGAVVGSHGNVARLLARGELIAIWPEGAAGGLAIAVLRCAEILAAGTGSQLWDYLGSRICLRPLGFDPMINVLSVDDALDAIRCALASDARGVFNIPGSTPCRCRA